jgi:vacuolar protein sorting-associated protein 26
MKNIVSALGFGKAPCRLEVEFDDDASSSNKAPSTSGRERGSVAPPPVFTDKDTIKGRVQVIPLSLKRVDHLGIRVQLFGEVVAKSDKHRPREFLSMVQDVAPSGDISAIQTLDFEFEHVEMPHESYHGSLVSLRYGLRVFMARSMGQTVIQDRFFDVRNPVSQILMLSDTVTDGIDEERNEGRGENDRAEQEASCAEKRADEDAAQEPCETLSESLNGQKSKGDQIKMEVGIEDCLHIEFEYGKDAYHLKDVVMGRINFVLVRIRLKHMELEIKRREVVGSGIDARSESTTVAKYEIMDGAPTKGESIPIRMYLSPYPLTPSYENVQGMFSVKYGLNLVLVDHEDRRYFKQQEIRLYRLSDDPDDALGTEPAWNLFSGVNRAHVQGEDGGEGQGEEAAPEERGEGGVPFADNHETGIDDGFSHIPL